MRGSCADAAHLSQVCRASQLPPEMGQSQILHQALICFFFKMPIWHQNASAPRLSMQGMQGHSDPRAGWGSACTASFISSGT